LAAAQSVTTSRRAEAGPSAELGEVLQLVLAPYMHASITLDGPKLDLGSQAANVIALVIHELATNSTKYGALSAPEGTVRVEWRRGDADISIGWVERNGPRITDIPRVAGFGTLLATRSIAALRGSISPYWQPQGLSVQITIPIAHLFG